MKNNDKLDFVKDGYTSEQELFAWELMCGDKFENFIKTPNGKLAFSIGKSLRCSDDAPDT